MSAHVVRVENGKFSFVRQRLTIDVLRNGESWINFQGGGTPAIMSLMAELDAARVVLEAVRKLARESGVPVELKLALERHLALVDDLEPPSEWTKP